MVGRVPRQLANARQFGLGHLVEHAGAVFLQHLSESHDVLGVHREDHLIARVDVLLDFNARFLVLQTVPHIEHHDVAVLLEELVEEFVVLAVHPKLRLGLGQQQVRGVHQFAEGLTESAIPIRVVHDHHDLALGTNALRQAIAARIRRVLGIRAWSFRNARRDGQTGQQKGPDKLHD